jgi:hypothetical protein
MPSGTRKHSSTEVSPKANKAKATPIHQGGATTSKTTDAAAVVVSASGSPTTLDAGSALEGGHCSTSGFLEAHGAIAASHPAEQRSAASSRRQQRGPRQQTANDLADVEQEAGSVTSGRSLDPERRDLPFPPMRQDMDATKQLKLRAALMAAAAEATGALTNSGGGGVGTSSSGGGGRAQRAPRSHHSNRSGTNGSSSVRPYTRRGVETVEVGGVQVGSPLQGIATSMKFDPANGAPTVQVGAAPPPVAVVAADPGPKPVTQRPAANGAWKQPPGAVLHAAAGAPVSLLEPQPITVTGADSSTSSAGGAPAVVKQSSGPATAAAAAVTTPEKKPRVNAWSSAADADAAAIIRGSPPKGSGQHQHQHQQLAVPPQAAHQQQQHATAPPAARQPVGAALLSVPKPASSRVQPPRPLTPTDASMSGNTTPAELAMHHLPPGGTGMGDHTGHAHGRRPSYDVPPSPTAELAARRGSGGGVNGAGAALAAPRPVGGRGAPPSYHESNARGGASVTSSAGGRSASAAEQTPVGNDTDATHLPSPAHPSGRSGRGTPQSLMASASASPAVAGQSPAMHDGSAPPVSHPMPSYVNVNPLLSPASAVGGAASSGAGGMRRGGHVSASTYGGGSAAAAGTDGRRTPGGTSGVAMDSSPYAMHNALAFHHHHHSGAYAAPSSYGFRGGRGGGGFSQALAMQQNYQQQQQQQHHHHHHHQQSPSQASPSPAQASVTHKSHQHQQAGSSSSPAGQGANSASQQQQQQQMHHHHHSQLMMHHAHHLQHHHMHQHHMHHHHAYTAPHLLPLLHAPQYHYTAGGAEHPPTAGEAPAASGQTFSPGAQPTVHMQPHQHAHQHHATAAASSSSMAAAELATNRMLYTHLIPTFADLRARHEMVAYVAGVFKMALTHVIPGLFDLKFCVFGSVQSRTCLPDGDNDVAVFVHAHRDDPRNKGMWDSHGQLTASGADLMAKARDYISTAHSEVIVDALVFAEVRVLKLVFRGHSVDFTADQIGGYTTAAFVAEVDLRVGNEHLFRRTLILLKAWALNEARILGSAGGYLSTYALSVMLMAVVNNLDGRGVRSDELSPLRLLDYFLQYYAAFSFFDHCVTIYGPVPATLEALTAFVDDLHSASPPPLAGNAAASPSVNPQQPVAVRRVAATPGTPPDEGSFADGVSENIVPLASVSDVASPDFPGGLRASDTNLAILTDDDSGVDLRVRSPGAASSDSGDSVELLKREPDSLDGSVSEGRSTGLASSLPTAASARDPVRDTGHTPANNEQNPASSSNKTAAVTTGGRIGQPVVMRCLAHYSGRVKPSSADSVAAPARTPSVASTQSVPIQHSSLFPVRHLNVMDPLRPHNNLTRGVCLAHLHRVRTAFQHGLDAFRRALARSNGDGDVFLREFLPSTIDCIMQGPRPDPSPTPSEASLCRCKACPAPTVFCTDLKALRRVADDVTAVPTTVTEATSFGFEAIAELEKNAARGGGASDAGSSRATPAGEHAAGPSVRSGTDDRESVGSSGAGQVQPSHPASSHHRHGSGSAASSHHGGGSASGGSGARYPAQMQNTAGGYLMPGHHHGGMMGRHGAHGISPPHHLAQPRGAFGNHGGPGANTGNGDLWPYLMGYGGPHGMQTHGGVGRGGRGGPGRGGGHGGPTAAAGGGGGGGGNGSAEPHSAVHTSSYHHAAAALFGYSQGSPHMAQHLAHLHHHHHHHQHFHHHHHHPQHISLEPGVGFATHVSRLQQQQQHSEHLGVLRRSSGPQQPQQPQQHSTPPTQSAVVPVPAAAVADPTEAPPAPTKKAKKKKQAQASAAGSPTTPEPLEAAAFGAMEEVAPPPPPAAASSLAPPPVRSGSRSPSPGANGVSRTSPGKLAHAPIRAKAKKVFAPLLSGTPSPSPPCPAGGATPPVLPVHAASAGQEGGDASDAAVPAHGSSGANTAHHRYVPPHKRPSGASASSGSE